MLGYGGEGRWSRDATEKVGPGTKIETESARGPPHGCERKEAQWEEGAREAESAASGSEAGRRGRPLEVPARQSVRVSRLRAMRKGQSHGVDNSEAE
jgi:hypothetical protein